MAADIALLDAQYTGALPLELVERKGLGHPDTICDALAEAVSAALSRFYLERCGQVLHHNVDKALLCGGAARPDFGGGGEILEPIEIHLAGRATQHFGGVDVPVEDLAIGACHSWIRRHLLELDPERDVRIIPHIRPTSPDLTSLFLRGRTAPLANDTSFGVGFAPLDPLERMVLRIAEHLNAPTTRQRHPALGADIKVMGSRCRTDTTLTIACAMIGRHIHDLDGYLQQKAMVRALAIEAAQQLSHRPVEVLVNTGDDEAAGSVYLTVTGLSAEAGDDGQVGRGNRVNGLITPYRPMSLEAAAGKNPVTHVGKLYNVMAHRIAAAVANEAQDVDECYCYLLSQIGRPIDQPQLFEVKVRLRDPQRLTVLAPQIQSIAQEVFGTITSVWREVVSGTLLLW